MYERSAGDRLTSNVTPPRGHGASRDQTGDLLLGKPASGLKCVWLVLLNRRNRPFLRASAAGLMPKVVPNLRDA